MIKTSMFHIMIFYPMIINILTLIILMLPMKISKFHPMTLMIILIMITMFITIKMNFLYNSWMSFMLFLMMIGGLMVIYMYISSLSNNELFQMNIDMIMMNMLKTSLLILTLMFMYFNYHKFLNTQDLWKNNLIIMFDQMNTNTMYKEMNNKSSYFIMLYLYYTMICIMNICYKNKAPLRQLII